MHSENDNETLGVDHRAKERSGEGAQKRAILP